MLQFEHAEVLSRVLAELKNTVEEYPANVNITGNESSMYMDIDI
ncbi:MAG: hypothetical protein NWS20_01190 [Rickettsiaceae bacterium]|nr:hypothetical protein [Rickettsiaceae bacterium]MDP4832655.1 hypothetical protein [Rickettsiaceae bacterium]MDP5020275.1 hypothetical protein [Rickettsiaceae bacterium]MDP5083696.1 hypothetical protein [Rickettsiaceae bacterium]